MFEKDGKFYADWRTKKGPAQTQIIHIATGRAPIRDRAKGTRPPKTDGERPTIATILLATQKGQDRHSLFDVAKLLIATAGSLTPPKLSAAHVMEVDSQIRGKGHAPVTVNNKSARFRRLLRWLWAYHGAPKLDELVPRHPGTRPRNVTATDAERETLLFGLPDHLKLLLLLCSDTAIRSGTAVRLNTHHYDPKTAELEFTTKMSERLRLPVTARLRQLIEQCNLEDTTPFVYQLWAKAQQRGRPSTANAITHPFSRQFAQARRALGITRKLTLHDFRRTTAVAMLRETHDILDVQALLGHRSLQSTIWYLDHDLRPVKRSTLETINRPTWAGKDKLA